MSAEAEAKSTPADPDMVSIEIDGRTIEARKGSMLIQAADDAGIYIPRFCYHKKLSIAANCRMCLVEVEKAPKPLPACATPVADGMKVQTRSPLAKNAQKGVMEFLLINHPLDCPICDQGGECQLQDLAVGYGKDLSRYDESKRIVKDKDLGPLISTELTRCIHCMRCVRFGQEIAGIMELGATGRGEHTIVGTYVERSVDSEISGNVIDLCPVGALTSKPYRYHARPWELVRFASISPHDSVGANLEVHTRSNQVLRVVPRENEPVNETWIADRDRYSYEAVHHERRITMPMIKVDGQWQETDWNSALEFVARGLTRVLEKHGPEQLGVLASPHCTTEEFYLLQKLARALGTSNIDHRVREMDFSDDAGMPVYPGLGQSLADLESLQTIVLVGANPRKEQPLIGLRLRKAQKNGARLYTINPVDYDFTHAPEAQLNGDPQQMLESLAGVVKALADMSDESLDASIARLIADAKTGTVEKEVASAMMQAPATIMLGAYAAAHAYGAQLRALAQAAADLSKARLSFLPAANSVGAWLAGCVPHRTTHGASADKAGLDAHAMIKDPLKSYLLLGMDPELDCIDSGRARLAMEKADFVISISAFKPGSAGNQDFDAADVLLPLSTFLETAGTHVNCAGLVQSFSGTAPAPGEARPGWKVLRVLGNLFELPGFDYESIEDVRADLKLEQTRSDNRIQVTAKPGQLGGKALDLYRIAELPIYRVDQVVRHADALQLTADNPGPVALVNLRQAQALGVSAGDTVRVRMLEGDAHIVLDVDDRIPQGCIWVPAGYAETSALGAAGQATVSKV